MVQHYYEAAHFHLSPSGLKIYKQFCIMCKPVYLLNIIKINLMSKINYMSYDSCDVIIRNLLSKCLLDCFDKAALRLIDFRSFVCVIYLFHSGTDHYIINFLNESVLLLFFFFFVVILKLKGKKGRVIHDKF